MTNLEPHEPLAPSEPERPSFQLGARELWMVAGFLVTVLLLDTALRSSRFSVMVPQVHAANQVQLLAHSLRTEREDVLMIGSSRMKEGIDPNIVTKLMNNDERSAGEAVKLPVQGMRAWTLHHIVRDMVAPDPPKKLLIVGLEERLFYVPRHETDEPIDIRMLADSVDLLEADLQKMTVAQLKELTLAPLRGLQAPWSLVRLLDPKVERYVEHLHETRGEPEYEFEALSRAEFERAREMRRRIDERASSYEGEELRPAQLDSFRRALDLLEELPCEVVFVRMPVLPEYDAEQEFELRQFREIVVPEVLERGFRVFDMNEDPELRDPKLYANPSHLNERGRRLASTWLAWEVVGPVLLGEEAFQAAFGERP